jgi:hypothetical protein
MARLSGWMQARGLTAAELTPAMVEKFLAVRRTRCRDESVVRRWVAAVLRCLRGHDVVPGPDLVGGTAVLVLLADYRTW